MTDEYDDKPGDQGAEQKPATESPFDPSRLRLTQNYADIVGVKKALITVPVRKPSRQTFIRTHPGSSYRLETLVLELRDDRETYLVDPSLWEAMPPGEISSRVLITTIDRQAVLSLWPIRLADESGRLDAWSRSALEIAEMARENWIRVAANMGLGAYEPILAQGDVADPEWPDIEFPKILEIAFRDRFITDLNNRGLLPFLHGSKVHLA